VIKDIEDQGMALTIAPDSVYAFLGVELEPLESGDFKMSPKGLTKKV
jgi:hypothetical protein